MLLLCSRCGKVVSLNVFKTGINAVSFLPIFSAVFLVFLTARWRLRYTEYLDSARVFDYDLYLRRRACLLCIFVPSPKVRFHFSMLLIRALFFEHVTVHLFSFHVWPFTFMLQVT